MVKFVNRLTFEYILLNGVNDRPEHAKQFVKATSWNECIYQLNSIQCG